MVDNLFDKVAVNTANLGKTSRENVFYGCSNDSGGIVSCSNNIHCWCCVVNARTLKLWVTYTLEFLFFICKY